MLPTPMLYSLGSKEIDMLVISSPLDELIETRGFLVREMSRLNVLDPAELSMLWLAEKSKDLLKLLVRCDRGHGLELSRLTWFLMTRSELLTSTTREILTQK